MTDTGETQITLINCHSQKTDNNESQRSQQVEQDEPHKHREL